jgi:hypothetical protein
LKSNFPFFRIGPDAQTVLGRPTRLATGVRAREEKRKATGLTKGAQLPGRTEPVRTRSSSSSRAGLTGVQQRRGRRWGGGQRRGSELDVGKAEKVAAARLVHLPPSVPPTAAGRGGAARAQKLAGVDVYGLTERAGEEEYV